MTEKTETPAQIAEAQAKRVYKAMTWGAEATLPKSIIPKWVEDGNSLAQVEARAVVQAIMEMQPAPLATQCEAGCVRYDGGEVRHLKECAHYAESLTKMFDDAVAENARLREALEPFSLALHIAQQACGVRMNVGYVETVAKLHIDHAHLVDAQEAMAGGET